MIFKDKVITTSVYGKFYEDGTVTCYDGNIYRCDSYLMDKIKAGALYEIVIRGIRINRLRIYPKVIGFRYLHD